MSHGGQAAGPRTVAHVFLDFSQGGAQGLALETWRHLDPERYRPLLICVRSAGAAVPEARAMGVPVRVLGRLRRPLDLAAPRALARTLRAEGVQILQTPLYSRVAPYARLAAALAGLPLCIGHEHCRPALPSLPRRLADRLLGRLPGQRYLAVSQADAADLRRQGIAAGRIACLPNGIDPAAYGREDRAAARRALGLPPQALVLLAPARLHPQKRHADLLGALAQVDRDGGRDWLLLCAGEGELRSALEAQAAAAGLAERVRFLGRRQDLPRLYAAADLVVLASAIEGLPLALLEAQAAGRAVLATAVGGVPEAVDDGRTGLLVPAGDPAALAGGLRRLLDDAALREALGAAGPAWVRERFGIDRYARELEALYDRWLAETAAEAAGRRGLWPLRGGAV